MADTSKFEHLKRSTYLPHIKESYSSSLNPRFGGLALILEDEKHPCCTHCNAPLHYLVQLDLEKLPVQSSALPTSGLLQVFTCHDSCKEDWEDFAGSKFCRIVPKKSFDKLVVSPVADRVYPEMEIQRWGKFDKDYPHPEEDCVADILSDDEFDDYLELTQQSESLGDKLFGWPSFVQGTEYGWCPDCQRDMAFVFQIASQESSPRCWGDLGIAMVWVCSIHPERVTYNWACA